MQDFADQLVDQIAFLKTSADRYDAGEIREAKRLATSIRILVHTTGRSTGLLSHLGVRDTLPWTDSARGPTDNSTGVIIGLDAGLCVLRISPAIAGQGAHASMDYHAPLEDLPPERIQPPHAFVDWWEAIVLTDKAGNSFRRNDIILSVADQDGGAHVDADLNEPYNDLTRRNSMRHAWSPTSDGCGGAIGFSIGDAVPQGDAPDSPIALAHVRQIAWEVLDTMQRHLVIEADRAYVRAPICPLPYESQPVADPDAACPCGRGRTFGDCFGRRQARKPLMSALQEMLHRSVPPSGSG